MNDDIIGGGSYFIGAGTAPIDLTSGAGKALIDEIISYIQQLYPKEPVTAEMAGFILGFLAARGWPDISDAVLATMVGRGESAPH